MGDGPGEDHRPGEGNVPGEGTDNATSGTLASEMLASETLGALTEEP
jgi:hypothetical protein